MKRTKNEKGITLVALIITVVVLLILAAVAINSIQNDGILSYAGNVANKYNQAQRDEQSVLDQYLGYLKGDEWVTIYEGPGTTEDGELMISDEHLFKDGNSYRITVKSDEFEGTVETVAVLYGVEDELFEYYILFGVLDEKAITANSLEEYLELQQTFGENATVVLGMSATEGTQSISYMFFDTTCEYTVTKIEAKAGELENNTEEDDSLIDDSLIFEGSLTLNGTELTPIVGIKRNISPAKQYRLDLIVDGVETTVYTEVNQFFSQVICFATIAEKDMITIGTEENQSCAKLFMNAVTCVITAIYEVGDASNYVEENGFGAFYHSNKETWDLVHAPSTDFIVPETVAGITINRVILDSIMYEEGDPVITFTKDIELAYYDVAPAELKFKIVSNDSEVVNSMIQRIIDKTTHSIVIDLTECGDDIEFTNDTLTKISSKTMTINVTSAVKAKYPDNANIVVP